MDCIRGAEETASVGLSLLPVAFAEVPAWMQRQHAKATQAFLSDFYSAFKSLRRWCCIICDFITAHFLLGNIKTGNELIATSDWPSCKPCHWSEEQHHSLLMSFPPIHWTGVASAFRWTRIMEVRKEQINSWLRTRNDTRCHGVLDDDMVANDRACKGPSNT